MSDPDQEYDDSFVAPVRARVPREAKRPPAQSSNPIHSGFWDLVAFLFKLFFASLVAMVLVAVAFWLVVFAIAALVSNSSP